MLLTEWASTGHSGCKLATHNTLTALMRLGEQDKSTVVGGWWPHFTRDTRGHRVPGGGSLDTALCWSPGSLMTWATWRGLARGWGQCVTSVWARAGQSPVSSGRRLVCHCMSVCHSHRVLAVSGPARTILHTRLRLRAADTEWAPALDHTASLTHGGATTVLTVQGWARAHSHWKAASPGLWASVRGSHCLKHVQGASDWRPARNLGQGLANCDPTSDLGNWHCWHIPRHRQQPFIKTTLAIWRLHHPLEKENV